MEYVTLKAATATVATDEGVFEAVISTENVDRENDIVVPEAMVTALHGWERPIPLAWNHSSKAEDIIGSLDGPSARVEDGEVIAFGDVDLDTVRGREAWRLMKKRIVGFSFGYLTTDAVKRADGGRTITGLDIFEVSVTMMPMNNATRVLGTKAHTEDGVRVQARDLRLEALLDAPERERSEYDLGVKAKSEPGPVKVTTFEC